MKYLLIALLLLSGCASGPIQPKGVAFRCAAMSLHGSYATWRGTYSTLADAEKDAQTITSNLIEKKLIPDSSFPYCDLDR